MLTTVDVEQKIAAPLAAHDALWRDVHRAVIAEERKRRRAEIAKLDLRLSALLAEVTKRQTVDAADLREHAVDGVLSIPSFLDRPRHGAA